MADAVLLGLLWKTLVVDGAFSCNMSCCTVIAHLMNGASHFGVMFWVTCAHCTTSFYMLVPTSTDLCWLQNCVLSYVILKHK